MGQKRRFDQRSGASGLPPTPDNSPLRPNGSDGPRAEIADASRSENIFSSSMSG